MSLVGLLHPDLDQLGLICALLPQYLVSSMYVTDRIVNRWNKFPREVLTVKLDDFWKIHISLSPVIPCSKGVKWEAEIL